MSCIVMYLYIIENFPYVFLYLSSHTIVRQTHHPNVYLKLKELDKKYPYKFLEEILCTYLKKLKFLINLLFFLSSFHPTVFLFSYTGGIRPVTDWSTLE